MLEHCAGAVITSLGVNIMTGSIITPAEHRRILRGAQMAARVVQGGAHMQWLVAMDLMREQYREVRRRMSQRGG